MQSTLVTLFPWKREGLEADVFSLDFLLSRYGRSVAENMTLKAHATKFLAASNFYKCVKLHTALCICSMIVYNKMW